MESSKAFNGLATGALLFALFAVIVAAVDFIGAIQPLSPTVSGWRYTSSASLTSYLGVPIVVALVAALAAVYLDRPGLTSRLALTCKIMAGLLVAIWIVFLVDSFIVRGGAAAEERQVGDIGIFQTSVKYLLYSLALFLSGRALSRSLAAQGK